MCPGGHVYSFDVNADHQQAAQQNYHQWLEHIRTTHQGCACGWENNVSFILADVTDSEMLTEIGQVHAVSTFCT